MGLNLHKIVRGSVTAVHPDIDVTLYQSTGKEERNERGLFVQRFLEVGEIRAQVQSLGTDDIKALDAQNVMAITRKIYLFFGDDVMQKPWAQFRPLGRTGDYIKDKRGQWWFVNAVLEDFSLSGWVSLQCILQTQSPDILIVTEDENDDNNKPGA